MKGTILGIMLILLVFGMLTLAFNIQPVKAVIIIVPDDYPTIQGAIDAASPGDTIFVKAGTYYENVVVNKPVSLKGECMHNTTVDGKGTGVVVRIAANGVNVTGFTIRNSGYPQCGLLLYYVSGCVVAGNVITANRYCGVYLYNSTNNIISGNVITANDHGGVLLYKSSNNVISGNVITANNENGVALTDYSHYNSVSGNVIANNNRGVFLSRSSNNTIFENNITSNDCGIRLDYASNNKFYHNSLIGNAEQVCFLTSGYANLWDCGYPFGGNYWSNYKGADLYSGKSQNEAGSDGIGDIPHALDDYNRDNYPLMAPFNRFDVGVWLGEARVVGIISNSSVFDFHMDAHQGIISFNVAGLDGTAGFCRVIMPNIIVEDLWHGNYAVLLNGEPWPFKNWTDSENTYIYISYTHSKQQIIIVPEFTLTAVLLLFTVLPIITIFRKENSQ